MEKIKSKTMFFAHHKGITEEEKSLGTQLIYQQLSTHSPLFPVVNVLRTLRRKRKKM